MYGAEVLVAAHERRALLVTRMNKHACDVRESRLTFESLYLDVPVSVVVELVLEHFFALAACDVVVGKHTFIEVAAQCKHVAIADGDALSLAKFAEVDACPAHYTAPHVHHPLAAVEARDLLCLHFHHDAIGFAHHRSNFLSREFHRRHALPADGIER